ncbi:WW domain binding protein 11-domain-containing protein [Mycena sp. CBHHK59/15]|nr:WW domain binding protein 11-domain-containing protein [Mycena sp. CBHHK59/15]
MAKGKNLNPADAYRKALRKKELKKNKAERSKTRDFSLVKKDTTDLEEEVERLEFATEPADKARYAEAKAELEKIYQKKEEYLKEHPEQRRLVYRHRKDGDKPGEEIVLQKRNFFDKNGLPRHPERSIYYDPVMNPYGVAPPGMPYQERPRNPGEVYSDDSDDQDDDVAMPEGPPPGDEDGDSDDDIPMPEGPPPGQQTSTSSLPPAPPSLPPHPPPPPPMALPGSLPPRPSNLPLPPPPPGFPPNTLPPRPPGFPGASFPPGFPSIGSVPPPNFPNFPPPGFPPPPPGFFPARNQASMQDPLSSVPHQTYQAHRAAAHSTLPPKPTSTVPPASASLPPKPVAAVSSANLMSATVFAAPELRDFKKEATAFVPTNVKRKKAAGAPGSSSRVNAAPSVSSLPSKPGSSGEESLPARPDLLGSLKGKFGAPPVASAATGKVSKTKDVQAAKEAKQKDDYDKFIESMGDILGPKK